MSEQPDTNASIWQSDEIVQTWTSEAAIRERNHAARWRFLASLLPFGPKERFTFLDLGAGTGSASQAILAAHQDSSGILADFSREMMSAGEGEMRQFAGRYRYVEFDLSGGDWPAEIPAAVDAVVTSQSVHHLPDERKQSLFAEILHRLRPGGWYFNYDPVRSSDPVVEAVWQRVNDARDPELAHKRNHPGEHERHRWENHLRYMIPLDQQLGYLRSAGFEGIDVYWKQLDYVIYGGRRPR